MIVIAIIKLLVILGIVATIHEFGHFIFSKLFKIGVEEFSIGFGPKIISKKYKGTIYSLRWIPLGGYVMIEGEGERSDSPSSFSKKNVFKQVMVLIAGAFMNFILAVALFIPIALPFPTSTSTITEYNNNSVLVENGMQQGDRITKINGDDITIYSQILNPKYAQDKVNIEYERNNVKHDILINNALSKKGYIGASFNQSTNNVISAVQKGMPAANAGIQKDDMIVSLDGVEVTTAEEIIEITSKNSNKEIKIQVQRNGNIIDYIVRPQENQVFDLGIKNVEETRTTFGLAVTKTLNKLSTMVSSYVDLFKGNVSINDVSSVVGIGVVVSETKGILEFLNMLAIISFAIGIANLLPIPPLDGFKIVIVIIESITRKKVPDKVQNILSLVGFGLLMLLTVVVTIKDIFQLF